MENNYNKMMSSLILFLALSFYNEVYSQSPIYNDEVRKDLNEMFEDLDKTKIPTGLLLDYAINIVDFDNYNGSQISDDNFVTASVFENMLYSINSSSVTTPPINNVAQIVSTLRSPAFENQVRMGFIGFRYNFIKANALSDNLINYNSGKVSDRYIAGEWQNPYGESSIFGFAVGKSIVHKGVSTFCFMSDLAFFNIPIRSFSFNAGDGQGFRNIIPGQNINIAYSTSGEKELILKIELQDGQIKYTHAKITVIDQSTLSEFASGPGVKEFIETPLKTHTGASVSAQVSIHYRTGYQSLTKPFIVVEGFDPWELLETLESMMLAPTNICDGKLGAITHQNFYDKYWQFSNDYDLIYVDWFDATADIRDNACLLVDIIERINSEKFIDGCNERTVLMGQSMGGLISRYALKMMEEDNKIHEVSTFISHDSPHLGANIPLGTLFLINQIMSFLSGYSTIIDIVDYFSSLPINDTKRLLLETMYSPAAKQMLANHIDSYGNIDNSIHDEFVSILDDIGFPEGDLGHPIENYAIVNGTENNQSDIFTSIGETSYLHGNINSNLLYYQLHAEAIVTPYFSNNTPLSIFRVGYTKSFLWITDKTYNYIFNSTLYSPPTGMHYDSFAGSTYSLDKDIFDGVNGDIKLAKRIMFIPTASALSMKNRSASDYLRNYYIDPPVPDKETPFDAYYLNQGNREHIYLSDTIYNWIYNQINLRIEGPDRASTDSIYRIANLPIQVEWSTSDTTIARIGKHDGKITAISSGIVDIIAHSYHDGELYRKKKTVLINFPDLYIERSFHTGVGYRFKVQAVDETSQEILNNLLNDENISYEWTYIDRYGNRETTITSSHIYEFLPETNVRATISVRMVDSSGNKSKLYSTTIDLQCPFEVMYKYVTIDSDGDVYWVFEDDVSQPLPQWDYVVSYAFPVYNEYDNLNSANTYLKGGFCYISYPSGTGRSYFTGIRSGADYVWTFNFWDSQYFMTNLNAAMRRYELGDYEIGDIIDFDMIVCNSLKEPLQRLKMAIIFVEY